MLRNSMFIQPLYIWCKNQVKPYPGPSKFQPSLISDSCTIYNSNSVQLVLV